MMIGTNMTEEPLRACAQGVWRYKSRAVGESKAKAGGSDAPGFARGANGFSPTYRPRDAPGERTAVAGELGQYSSNRARLSRRRGAGRGARGSG